MNGVVFLGDRKLELREFPRSNPPGSRDVILEIKASGMRGSDLHNYRAPAQPRRPMQLPTWRSSRGRRRGTRSGALRDEGPAAEARFIEAFARHPIGNVHRFAGCDQIRAWEEAFLSPEELAKYEGSVGHQSDRS